MSKQLDVVVWSKEGCSYCAEVKGYLKENNIEYKTIDVTNHDEFRDILDTKYGVRHVPVVEIGKNGTYTGVTEVGLEHLKNALATISV
ncbi:glutaredoxin family protein [Caldifermentibacillus hisashii]|jgi:glutaredoxin|uniref:glutaredoxin family protein n=1 Tax=Caldifermentibacillus hisashii TaxID=996558 RepID=UPI0022B9D3A7|nr:glutaredoxin family protein [Caldifermentibacillus hisashii]